MIIPTMIVIHSMTELFLFISIYPLNMRRFFPSLRTIYSQKHTPHSIHQSMYLMASFIWKSLLRSPWRKGMNTSMLRLQKCRKNFRWSSCKVNSILNSKITSLRSLLQNYILIKLTPKIILNILRLLIPQLHVNTMNCVVKVHFNFCKIFNCLHFSCCTTGGPACDDVEVWGGCCCNHGENRRKMKNYQLIFFNFI